MQIKKDMEQLTEGMQHLCAVANRIVAHQDKTSRIELDLMAEDLRHLYDVVMRMADAAGPVAEPQGLGAAADDRRMAMLSTMAAVAPAEAQPVPQQEQPQSAPAVVVPVAEPIEEQPMAEPATEPAQAEPAPQPQSTVEEIHLDTDEVDANGLLFEEVLLDIEPETEPVEVPEPEPEPVVDEPMAEPEPVVEEPMVEPEPVVEEPMVEPEPVEEEPMVEPEPVVEEPMAEPEPVMEAPAPEIEPAAAEEEVATDEPPQQPAHTPHIVQASLLDYLQGTPQRTLAETLATAKPEGSSLERKVDDLRTVININDRFVFMSELFGNNIKEYNDFINVLNSATSRDEALGLVQALAERRAWDPASPAVSSFYKVLDKKF